LILPGALGVVLLFSVLAFAATEQWALSIAQVAIFALGIACAMRRKLRWRPLGLALAGVVCLGALQLAAGITVYRFLTANAMVSWSAYFVLLMVSQQVLAGDEARHKFLRATLYAGFAIAVLSTVQYFTSGGAIYWMFPVRAGRPFGPFVDPDHYAAFIELILPLAIYEAQRDRARSWAHTAIAGALYGSVIASASRTGAALATVEILVLPLLSRRAGISGKVIAMSVAFAGLATTVVGWDVLWNRFQDKDPLRYRREIMASTLQMIERRPWTGFGLGTYQTVYPEFASFDAGLVVDHAHNDWAEWTAEGGIPMLLLIAPLALLSLRPAIRSGWALGIHAVFLHSLVDFPMQIPAIAFLLFTLLGALYSSTGREDPATLRRRPCCGRCPRRTSSRLRA
jgi:O-antigen ligase